MAAHEQAMTAVTAARRRIAIGIACLVSTAIGHSQGPPRRVVSLIPATTEMLFAMGAGPQVVGVSNFDRYPPEAATRTKVGGLIDPDIERILSLKPDLVIVFSTQDELQVQLQQTGIPMYRYHHAGLADITQTIRTLGQRVSRTAAAAALADRVDSDIAVVRHQVAGRRRPRTLLIFGRDAGSLRGIYASGGRGFLHDMLEVAGGENVFADVDRENVQATAELILARAPDVILEVRTKEMSTGSGPPNLRVWDTLPGVPAVRMKRVSLLSDDIFVTPGPRVAAAIRRFAEILHPEAFKQ